MSNKSTGVQNSRSPLQERKALKHSHTCTEAYSHNNYGKCTHKSILQQSTEKASFSSAIMISKSRYSRDKLFYGLY